MQLQPRKGKNQVFQGFVLFFPPDLLAFKCLLLRAVQKRAREEGWCTYSGWDSGGSYDGRKKPLPAEGLGMESQAVHLFSAPRHTQPRWKLQNQGWEDFLSEKKTSNSFIFIYSINHMPGTGVTAVTKTNPCSPRAYSPVGKKATKR